MNDKYYAGKDICEVITELFEHIGAMPAADVVKVVRCKDCWRSMEGKYGLECALRYDMHDRSDRIVPEDGYCNWGERKEGEG